MYERNPTWRILRANVRWIDGVPLEEMDLSPQKDLWARVLIHRDWNSLYFMVERRTWTDNDYFEYAQRRIRELGIKPP